MSLEHVTFDADGVTLAGHLHRPDDATGDLPAVVVTGAWTTVKEQMAGLYAERLAEQGFVALAVDFTGYGESGGQPRDVESPSLKVSDLHHAVAFLSGVNGVDPARIGSLGICAGSAFSAVHAAADPRVRSLALVAPGLQDGELARMALGGEESFQEHLATGQKARAHYEATGEVEYVAAVSDTDPTAAMYGPFTYYLDPGRGAIPEYGNRFALMAWAEWLTFEPIPSADDITVPVLLVHSDTAAVPDGARRFAARLKGPHEFVWLDDRSQFDFYDTEPTVTESVTHATRHFAATL
ncbi:alpha/beta fold hydrolase [Nonomuraea sp. NPDC000554]|uniref:alpha/beta hydrolase n=1 Tax=Nonomuraea sp. NPDC000554 TaxID=3154259 RepID=UPI00332A3ECB